MAAYSKRLHLNDDSPSSTLQKRQRTVVESAELKVHDDWSLTMTEEERKKLEAKRAYNRLNAARARKRTKQTLQELCGKVERFSDINEALETKNQDLSRKVTSLTEENKLLRRLLVESNGPSVRPMIPVMTAPTSLRSLSLKTGQLPQGMVQHIPQPPNGLSLASMPFWNHSGMI